MPRRARIDYEGALHHVMVRGLERREIFQDDQDRESFLNRLEIALEQTAAKCHAFALMPNHAHLLITSGKAKISLAMQILLTRYAGYYNWRHHRSGRLFQNRFKSILCDKDAYFLALVRYIHLNPLRAGIVPDLAKLDKYQWTGHAVYMGRQKRTWLATRPVLRQFGRAPKATRRDYRKFIQAGIAEGIREDLRGGGLIRSLGGTWELVKASRRGDKERGDERILGGGAFVEEVLKATKTSEKPLSVLKRKGWDFDRVVAHAAQAVRMQPEDLLRRGHANARSRGRALVCKWMTVDLCESYVRVGARLGISRQSVARRADIGRRIERELKVSLQERAGS